MHITPLDLRKQDFNKKIMGYDVDEVKSFLEMVATELENVNRRNHELEEKLVGLEEQNKTYKKIEQQIQDTLMTAQRVTDEVKVNAQKEADLLLKDAQIRVQKEIQISHEKVLQHQRELAKLRQQKGIFISRFRTLVNSQMEMLNILQSDDEEAGAGESREDGNNANTATD